MEDIMNSYDEDQEVDKNAMEVDEEEPALTTAVPENVAPSPSHEQNEHLEDSPMELDQEIALNDIESNNNQDLGDNSTEIIREEKSSEWAESDPSHDQIPEQSSTPEPEQSNNIETEEHNDDDNGPSMSEAIDAQPVEEEVNEEQQESPQIVESITKEEEPEEVSETQEANKPDEDHVVEVEVTGDSSSDEDSSEEEIIQGDAVQAEVPISESNHQQEKEEIEQTMESESINNDVSTPDVDTNTDKVEDERQEISNTKAMEDESPEQACGDTDNISSAETIVEVNLELFESTVEDDTANQEEPSSKPSEEVDESTMLTEKEEVDESTMLTEKDEQQQPQESINATEEVAVQKGDAAVIPESDPEKEMLKLMSTLEETVTSTETLATSTSIQQAMEHESEEAPTISNYSENELMEMMEVVTTSEQRTELTDSPSQLGSEGSTAEESSHSDDIFTHKFTVDMEAMESSTSVTGFETGDVLPQSTEPDNVKPKTNEEFNESWMQMDEGERTESHGSDANKTNQQDTTNINDSTESGTADSNEVGTPATTTTNATTTAIDSEEEEFQLKTSRKKPSMFAPDNQPQQVAKPQPAVATASTTTAAAADKRDLAFLQNNFSFQQAPLHPVHPSSAFKATLPADKYDPIGVHLLAVQSTLSTTLMAMVKKRNFKATAGRKRKLEEALSLIRQGCDLLATELTDPDSST